MRASHDANDERAALDLLVRGFRVSRMLRLVADLGVADRIAPDGRDTIGTLSENCGTQPQPLIRVLRALAAFGVFTVSTDGEIGHTPRSDCYVRGGVARTSPACKAQETVQNVGDYAVAERWARRPFRRAA